MIKKENKSYPKKWRDYFAVFFLLMEFEITCKANYPKMGEKMAMVDEYKIGSIEGNKNG